jgi:hypothetical protein
MKRIFILFLFLLAFTVSCRAQETGWKELKSTHFVVYYKDSPEDFIKELSDKAEIYYERIADNLGFRRFDFWLWDNRAKIYVFDNAGAYKFSTGQPDWSVGCATVGSKTIHTFYNASGFMDRILPHEMAHLIFREFVGTYNYAVPQWLEEGVADSQETQDGQITDWQVQEGIRKNKFMGIPKLTNYNLRMSTDKELVSLYYAESASIVNFLLKEFGKDKFVLFCQYLRDTQSLQKALVSAYSFGSVDELNEAWLKYLKNG